MSEADGRGGPRPGTALRLIGPTVLVLLLMAAAGALGWWQLGAWQDRRSAETLDLTQLEPVPLADLMGADDPFPGMDVGRPVTIEGVWLPQGSFYVSGREHEGRDGLWVVVPLAVGDSQGPAIPVVIGWTESIEGVETPTGPVSIEGWLQPTDGNSEIDADPEDDIVPQLRTADAVQRVDNDLYSAYAVATDPAPGLSRASLDALPEAGQFTAVRNLFYALEWWFFGGFAVFVWWRWVRDEQEARAAASASRHTDDGPSVD